MYYELCHADMLARVQDKPNPVNGRTGTPFMEVWEQKLMAQGHANIELSKNSWIVEQKSIDGKCL